MRLVLGYTTAVECWQRVGALSHLGKPALTDVVKTDTSFTLPELQRLTSAEYKFLEKPLHVLVASDSNRRNSQHVQCHTCSSELPLGSIYMIDREVYLVSPELCFVQMAPTLPFLKLVELGMEFCGTYQPSSFEQGASMQRHEPLTQLQDIKRYLEHETKRDGVARARRAVDLLQDGSASPMETFLWMRLCLPLRYGGRGFPPALLNYPIELDRDGRRATGKQLLRCDLFFPEARVAVEYDSNEYHTAEERIASDSVRRGALECLGISVVTITSHEFFTYNEFEGKVRQLAKLMGMRLRKPTEKQLQQRKQLRDELLNPGLMNYRINRA